MTQENNTNHSVLNRQYNLFDNPSVIEAKARLTDEERRAYEKYGELAMSIEYDDVLSCDLPDYIKTSAKAYLDVLINGNCTEAQMSKEEIDVIVSVYGDDWRRLLE